MPFGLVDHLNGTTGGHSFNPFLPCEGAVSGLPSEHKPGTLAPTNNDGDSPLHGEVSGGVSFEANVWSEVSGSFKCHKNSAGHIPGMGSGTGTAANNESNCGDNLRAEIPRSKYKKTFDTTAEDGVVTCVAKCAHGEPMGNLNYGSELKDSRDTVDGKCEGDMEVVCKVPVETGETVGDVTVMVAMSTDGSTATGGGTMGVCKRTTFSSSKESCSKTYITVGDESNCA